MATSIWTSGASTVIVEEEDRQMILLALALTSLQRPGFHYFCGEIAKKFSGEEMFEKFRELNADQHQLDPKTIPAAVHILKHGLPLCQFSLAVPRDWPAGHRWIGFQDARGIEEHVTCRDCKANHKPDGA